MEKGKLDMKKKKKCLFHLNAHQLRDHVTLDPAHQGGFARHVVNL